MKFRKKPIVIEAFQITEDALKESHYWPDWLLAAWEKEPQEVGCIYRGEYPGDEYFGPRFSDRRIFVHTLEGVLQVAEGDWMIKGIKGDLYPCKPDIFEATYELVELAT